MQLNGEYTHQCVRVQLDPNGAPAWITVLDTGLDNGLGPIHNDIKHIGGTRRLED